MPNLVAFFQNVTPNGVAWYVAVISMAYRFVHKEFKKNCRTIDLLIPNYYIIRIRMNLKEFVTESIVEIIDGIVEAQEKVSKKDAKIIPKMYRLFTESQKGGTNLALGWDEEKNLVHTIEFDVAVTANDGTETKGGVGVVAGIFALGSQGKSEESSQSISRLKFRVPVSFPRQIEED
ncbi:MAG: hypothetical protein D3923_08020 [Candidatus Electrothrix sp. AR3]|nr:hypothetical protein [Candidatus Electrothrix sp. AR3]